MLIGTLLVLIALIGAQTAEARGGVWRAPVPGPVSQAFDYDRATPFAPGQRRNVAFDGARGTAVGSACSGEVLYAGPVPGQGIGVTVRCGGVVATHLGLTASTVRAHRKIVAGTKIGVLGGDGLRLGARRAADRWGYIDPRALIAAAPNLGPAPAPTRWPRLRREPPRRTHWAPRRSGQPSSNPPLIAWLGLAAAGAALGGGSVRRRWGPSTSPRRSTTSMQRRTSGTPMR